MLTQSSRTTTLYRYVPLLTLLGVLVVPTNARAQTGLLTEAARDPGRADTPQTARQLALGSVLASNGAADSAATAPGTLTLQSGSDLVFAAGSSRYARPELVLTPRTGANDGLRRQSEGRPTPIAHVAAATRGPNWAIAGFLDRSGYSHAFKTDRNLVQAAYLFPSCVEVSASGEARVDQSVTRSGGSVAVGNSRVGAGVSFYGVHLDYVLEKTELLEHTNCSANRPRSVSYENRNGQLRFDHWAAGISASGQIGLGRAGLVIGRWRREPRFTAMTDGGSRVDFKLPDTLSAAWMMRTNLFAFIGELSWHEYGVADFVLSGGVVPQKLLCDGLDLPDATGNPVPCGMRSTFSMRTGFERRIHAGKGRLLLRGGVAYEPGYTFARETYPWGFGRVRGLSGPMRWDPPRDDSIWISGGAAYARGHGEVGAGVGHSTGQLRVLVDLRLRP